MIDKDLDRTFPSHVQFKKESGCVCVVCVYVYVCVCMCVCVCTCACSSLYMYMYYVVVKGLPGGVSGVCVWVCLVSTHA